MWGLNKVCVFPSACQERLFCDRLYTALELISKSVSQKSLEKLIVTK